MSRMDEPAGCRGDQHEYVAFTDLAQRCRRCGALRINTPAWGTWLAGGAAGPSAQAPAPCADLPYVDDVEGTVIWPPPVHE